MMAATRLLRMTEVAKRLQVHPSTCYRAAREGRIPHVVVLGGVRVPEDLLEAWIRAQIQGPAVPEGGGERC